VLSKILAGSEKLKKATLGGAKATAEILNFLANSWRPRGRIDPGTRRRPGAEDPGPDVHLRQSERTGRSCHSTAAARNPVRVLDVALKGSDQAAARQDLQNMSGVPPKRCAKDLEAKGPVRISEVEAEQREILKVVRRLADEGRSRSAPRVAMMLSSERASARAAEVRLGRF